MLLFFLFFNNDTIPPLPDISEMVFPEPPIFILPRENTLLFNGLAGNFYYLHWILKYNHLNLYSRIEQKGDWDTIRQVEVKSSYSLPLSHFWINPGFTIFYQRRDEKYQLLQPSLEFSSPLPWSILFGKFNYGFYKNNFSEQTGNLNLVFDRYGYYPHLEFSFLHNQLLFQPQITAYLHLGLLHIGFGSLILHNFPAPIIEIKFLSPKIKNEILIRSGVEIKPFIDYFDPDAPERAFPPMPVETLKIKLGNQFKLSTRNHSFKVLSRYRYYSSRLTVDSLYNPILTGGIDEFNFIVGFENSLNLYKINLFNLLSFQYNRTNLRLPFIPNYSFNDTLRMGYKFLEFCIEMAYSGKRRGISKELKSLLLINVESGLRIKIFRFFFLIKNLTNKRDEIFDNYYLKGIQFAGGIGIRARF